MFDLFNNNICLLRSSMLDLFKGVYVLFLGSNLFIKDHRNRPHKKLNSTKKIVLTSMPRITLLIKIYTNRMENFNFMSIRALTQ